MQTNGTQMNTHTNGTESAARSGFALPAPVVPGAGFPAPAPHDWLTRLRDKWGNRLGWSSVFSIPTVDDVPLEQTPLAPGLRAIEAQLPVRASTLHHFYDYKLRPALRRFWHVLAEETARLEAGNAFAAQRNAEITAQQQALEADRDLRTAPDRQALTALEDGPLTQAHEDAALKVAQAGGVYDPANPLRAASSGTGEQCLR